MRQVRTVIVGSPHLPTAAGQTLQMIKRGDQVVLRREPNNAVDALAVAVYFGEQQIGYIPRNANPPVAAALDAGAAVTATVTLEAGPDTRRMPAKVQLAWEDMPHPSPSQPRAAYDDLL